MSLLCVEGLEGEGEGWQALLAPRQLSSQMLQLRLLQIPAAANKPCHTLASIALYYISLLSGLGNIA